MSETGSIVLEGVRVHNLKSIRVEFPLRRMTVVTGVSGAGKSSLVFDTLYAEAQRRYLQSFSTASRQLFERFEQPDADAIGDLPPAIALRRRASGGAPRATVGSLTEVADYLCLLLARVGDVYCWQCGMPVKASSTADVVAATQALPAGTRFNVAFPSPPTSTTDREAWIAGLLEEGLVRVQVGPKFYRLGEDQLPPLRADDPVWVVVDRLEAGKPALDRLTDSVETAFARGDGRLALLLDGEAQLFDRRFICLRCGLDLPAPEPRLFDFNDPRGACFTCGGTGFTAKKHTPCAACNGGRWNRAALATRLAGRNIAELSALSIGELLAFIVDLIPKFAGIAAATVLLDQLLSRLRYLTAIDLAHLTASRPATNLSGGEAVRLRLAASLASNLAQALYLIEEPTADLHPRDLDKLLTQLRRLRDTGNTIVVVDHNRHVIAAADHIVDLGPHAGADGGIVTYTGPPAGLLNNQDTPTAEFFSGRRTVALPFRRRAARGSICLRGARTHNLRNFTVDFPLGALCVVTGVGGAGKRSLIAGTLYPALAAAKKKKGMLPLPGVHVSGAGQIEDVILMDQQPLPRSARSNPATYLKIFDEIRAVFATTVDARIRNFGPGTFSFNQPGGRCETCAGQGVLTVDMQFLADVSMTCPECHGSRYRHEVLEVRVRGLNIAEVLNLTARDAFRFFRAQPGVERRLKYLLEVGLDYPRLGQPTETLSGGEAQRLKLAGHLASSRKPRCLFLMLEPSAGLHPADVDVLLGCYDRLLSAGHSLVLVENNLDIICRADHVIDLGPDGGAGGGNVVAVGTPEAIVQHGGSPTAVFLGNSMQERDSVNLLPPG